ncbi:hypothetical protein TNCV_5069561 [Trichonephila clavipes]|nr:hypothetical protein TNCV_5069561 [Trichonephila clavipes]
MDELNSDQAPQDINKEEFQLERVRLQAFVAATEPGCKKELIRNHLDNFTRGRMIGKPEEVHSLASEIEESGINKSVISCAWKALQTICTAVRKVVG